MLSDLQHEAVLGALYFERVENRRQLALELHVHNGTDNLRNLALPSDSAEGACSVRRNSLRFAKRWPNLPYILDIFYKSYELSSI